MAGESPPAQPTSLMHTRPGSGRTRRTQAHDAGETQVRQMANEKHAAAFIERLLDMLGYKAEKEAEAKEITDEERRWARKQQRRLPLRTTPRRKRAPR